MKYNIKAFWNGSIMFDANISADKFKNIQAELEDDFFKRHRIEQHIQESVELLNDIEADYARQYAAKGTYEFDIQDAAKHMLMINSLVKRGIVKDDDKYGLMIMKSI
jgi:uncharacterized membrane-anchored protein YhcB (DUF1043 family)